ncbi:MAG: hypothetical protein QNJ54_13735 [Prochloraceae cyanobacterium]|nr:hypothetical protein [Prochloraceae cyanobacterium]
MGSKIVIYQIICLEETTLMVFYTPERGWQCSCFNRKGQAYRHLGIFCNPEKATEVGRDWVKAIAIKE